MHRPIRLNRAIWPAAMNRLRRGIPDPRRLLDPHLEAAALTEILQRMKIGSTYKTTRYDRFPETTRLLASLPFARPPVVLDVGASDGSTALAVMRRLAFRRYYVTDLNIRAQAVLTHAGVFFCDGRARPWLYVNRCFVVFNDVAGARWPFGPIAAQVFADFDAARWPDRRDVLMVNPELAAMRGDRICIERYNVFEAWSREPADLVVAANLLNRVYFSDDRLREALANLRAAMREGAVLAVIENRAGDAGPREQASLFRRVGNRLRPEARVGAGSDIHTLVAELA
ncbi:MAG TPA: hypothetical protein VFQ95_06715 [Rhodanobacteraceae bacterium]|nr:hypothetical protein [Rhodanobacteraceae bacterium]